MDDQRTNQLPIHETMTLNEDDLDDAIRKLEAKLDNDGSVSSDESNDEEEEERKNDSVILSSALSSERIDGLPDEYLPKTKKRILRGIDDESDKVNKKKSRITRKEKIERDKVAHCTKAGINNDDATKEIKAKVNEILGNYQPRSAIERLPFYCRYCSKVCGNSEEEFFAHMETLFHKTALEMERKASYCKLCRKQLTSQIQLKEHIKSKPHRRYLDMFKQKQRQQASFKK